MKLTRCNKCVTGKNEITLFPDPARQFPGRKAERGVVSCPDQEGALQGRGNTWKTAAMHRRHWLSRRGRGGGGAAPGEGVRACRRACGRVCMHACIHAYIRAWSHTRAREFHDTEPLRSHHRFVIWAPWVFPKSGL